MPTLPDLLLYASALLMGTGLLLVLSRTHAVAALMGVELLLNAAMLNLIGAGLRHPGIWEGQVLVVGILVVAAAEAAVALALVLNLFHARRSVDLAEMDDLHG